MEHLLESMRQFRDIFLDICFPIRCLKCGIKGIVLCEPCAETIPESNVELPNIYAGFTYQDPSLKKLLKDLKYHNKYHAGQILGALLYGRFIEEISELRTFSLGAPIIVIPIPLSEKRKKLRGYNQAEKIAQGFISQNPRIFALDTTSIQKYRDTIPQARISKREMRESNILNCFSITQDTDFNGRTVIVLDDIVTTGSTLREVMDLVLKNGAKRVIAIAVAH